MAKPTCTEHNRATTAFHRHLHHYVYTGIIIILPKPSINSEVFLTDEVFICHIWWFHRSTTTAFHRHLHHYFLPKPINCVTDEVF